MGGAKGVGRSTSLLLATFAGTVFGEIGLDQRQIKMGLG